MSNTNKINLLKDYINNKDNKKQLWINWQLDFGTNSSRPLVEMTGWVKDLAPHIESYLINDLEAEDREVNEKNINEAINEAIKKVMKR